MSEIQVDLNAQIVSFWIAVALGAVLCVLYDAFKFVRLLFRSGKTAIFAQDLAWWLITALVTYVLLLVRCKGVVRSYAVIGEVVGFAGYRFTVSRLTEKPLKKLAKILRAVYVYIKNRILLPVTAAVVKIIKWIEKIFKKFINFLKNHLKQSVKIVYNSRKYVRKRPKK